MPETPQSNDPGQRAASDAFDLFDDFPLDVELRELYLRLRLDGAIWAQEQPADEGRLAAYAIALAEPTTSVVAAGTDEADEAAMGAMDAATPTRSAQSRLRVRRASGFMGNVGALIAAVAVVVLFSFTLLRLSPLAGRLHPSDPGSGSASVIETATATSAPTATATSAPTATNAPKSAATEAPLEPFSLSLVRQSNGKTLSEYLIRNGTNAQCSPDYLNFQALVKFTHSNPGVFTFEWRFYDGANPLPDPTAAGFSLNYGPAPGDYTPTSDETLLPSNGSDFQVSMQYTGTPQYSSTPRWGAQFVVTAINGNALATPIASDIIELATPAC